MLTIVCCVILVFTNSSIFPPFHFSAGVGKTTLTQKVCETLKLKSIPVSGFYTTEIRTTSGGREGFDVVTLNGNKKGVLARKRYRSYGRGY